jgi:hypothetical protein
MMAIVCPTPYFAFCNGPCKAAEGDRSTEMLTDELATLEARLERARRRAEDEPPFSPDWDAAMGEVEDLEQHIADLTSRTPLETILAGSAIRG